MTMRVLYPFSGHVVGGSHLSALTLAQNLPPGIEPVVAVAQEGPLTRYLDERGIPWLKLPRIRSARNELGRAVVNVWPLRRFLKQNHIDIVHSNEYDMNSLWPLAKAGLAARHIWHQRSLNNSRRLALYAPFVDHYLTISAFCRDNLPNPVRTRAEILPNPVEIAGADGAGIDPSVKGFKIGFAGHLDHQKRIMTVIGIAKRLAGTGLHPSFFIFGDNATEGGRRAEQAVRDARLEKRFFFMGQKFPIAPWIKSLDLLLAPAANEGLGRALIEAQLLGVPVLASNHGGHRELVRHGRTGWLAPLDDEDAFAQQIAAFMAAPDEMRSVCAAARDDAASRYSVLAHVARVADLYRALVSSR